jgi:hypothetical protein
MTPSAQNIEIRVHQREKLRNISYKVNPRYFAVIGGGGSHPD